MQKTKSITVQEVEATSQEKGLMLNVIYSDGRYICRTVNKDNQLVTVSSRKSLVEAVTDTIQKA